MKVSLMYLSTIEALKQMPKNKKIIVKDESVSVTQLINELTKMMGWLYKDLNTDDIEKVVRCYNCKYYRKYKKKRSLKSETFYACSLDKAKRRPDFFCKDGDNR